MKRKLMVMAVVLVVSAASLTAFGSDDDILQRIEALEQRVEALEALQAGSTPDGVSAVQDPEPEALDNVETGMVAEGSSLSYKKAETGKTYNGEDDAVILYFDYINESGETSAAGYDFYVKVFQNGREMDSATISDNQAIKDAHTEFRSGAGIIEVAFARKISDNSDIIVNISSMKDWNAEDVEFAVSLE